MRNITRTTLAAIALAAAALTTTPAQAVPPCQEGEQPIFIPPPASPPLPPYICVPQVP